jgi:hypothetical protein
VAQLPASSALREALTGLRPVVYTVDPVMLEPLHEKVCGVVDELKEAGLTPEHVVLAIKRIADEAGLGVVGRRLIDQMIRWCLAHYFAESTGDAAGGTAGETLPSRGAV